MDRQLLATLKFSTFENGPEAFLNSFRVYLDPLIQYDPKQKKGFMNFLAELTQNRDAKKQLVQKYAKFLLDVISHNLQDLQSEQSPAGISVKINTTEIGTLFTS